ncbi:hypothetical protein NMY22_g9566 [Coprinellus aureogranulatus]|nr:hypothetical protein NMY22_g9566 [Coprinellus aureogranulatus]
MLMKSPSSAFIPLAPPVDNDEKAPEHPAAAPDSVNDSDIEFMDSDLHSVPSLAASSTGNTSPSSQTSIPTTKALGKRPLPPSHTFMTDDGMDSSDSEPSDSAEGKRCKRKKRSGNGAKPGSSWAKQKDLRTRVSNADFVANDKKLAAFRNKILDIDSHAEFDDDDLLKVRCSACGSTPKMRVLYDIQHFKTHRQSKKCQSLQSGPASQTLFSLGFKKKKDMVAKDRSALCMLEMPCPGLTAASDSRIATYLARTSALTGGAPSRQKISLILFGHSHWSELSATERKAVLRREEVLARWKNSRAVSSVFSSTCLNTVYGAVGADPPACEECKSLYDLKTFRAALRRKMPLEDNWKYVPKARRCPELGDIYLRYHGLRRLMEETDSPWLEFAKGVVRGDYTSDTLLGMVQAMVIKNRRAQAGKGLQNIRYTTGFSDFCNVLSSLSAVAYRTFQQQFGGPTLKTLTHDGAQRVAATGGSRVAMRKLSIMLRSWRTRKGPFRPGISPPNFVAAAQTLRSYDYAGPIALSWDDTELEPAISVYQESEGTCLIIGGTEGIIRVDEGMDLDAVFQQAQLKKATKLRIWLLTIPLPNIPPILVAAEARGASDSAEDLKAMHDRVMSQLALNDIHPTLTIPNTHFGPSANIELTIPLINPQRPLVLVQDSKHALKTARNQLLTGARILAMGNEVMHYEQLFKVAEKPDGPLYRRDVERVDRQDDAAAARTFSPEVLDFEIRTFPEHRALAIYTFVIGELVDAWQNRRISHLARAKMVMRAKFFLMAWRAHIDKHPDHSANTHFISRESYDILLTLCDSLLSLIIAYRRYYPTSPLLPWLHSTEPDEHVFGSLRKLKPDFTFADMLAAAHKLFALIAGAFRNLTPEQKAQQTASGYYHTYFKAGDVDLKELARYPSDADLARISDVAAQEVAQLCAVVGIEAARMISVYTAPVRSAHRQRATFTRDSRETLASLLDLYDNTWRSTPTREEDAIESYQYALAAEKAAQSQAIHDLPDPTSEDISAVKDHLTTLAVELSDEAVASPDLPAPSASTTSSSSDIFTPLKLARFGNVLDGQVLVSERMRHQTAACRRATRQRTRAQAPVAMDMNADTLRRFVEQGPTLREQLVQKLKDVLGSEVGKNKTSGVGRQVRWYGTIPGQATTAQEQNKAIVQSVAAGEFVRLREPSFASFRGIHENFHIANIATFNPLSPGHFVIALSPVKGRPRVFIGEVIALYSKGNGKRAKHEWRPALTALGNASYIYVRLYSPMAGQNIFTSLDCMDLSSPTFIQVPRTHLLFSLSSFASTIQKQTMALAHSSAGSMDIVTLDAASSALFAIFRSRQDELYECVKNLKLRLDGKLPDEDSDEDSETESEE